MNVTATIRNGEGEQPMNWSKNVDAIEAVEAVVQLMRHAASDEPFAPKIVAIHVTL